MVEESDYRQVFMGGSPSTGSTLLRIILDRHPRIFGSTELSTFNKQEFLNNFDKKKDEFPAWLTKGLRTSGYSFYYAFFNNRESDYGITDDQLITWSREADNVKQLLDRFIRHCMKGRQEDIFLEKTPSNVLSFPELSELFPRAKFIHMTRDGRDVLCSLKKRWFTRFQAASAWLFNTAAGIRLRESPRYMEVSYEELVTHTEETIRNLCEFLEVEFVPEMLDNGQGRFKGSNRLQKAWRANPLGPIRSVSLNRYQEELSDFGRAIFRLTELTSAGGRRLHIDPLTTTDLMHKLGYETDSIHIRNIDRIGGAMHQYYDWAYRTLKSFKHLEKPDPPLTRISRRF